MESDWVTKEAINLFTGMSCVLVNGLMTSQLSVTGILVKGTPQCCVF